MRLATSSCDPPCQERRNITHAFYIFLPSLFYLSLFLPCAEVIFTHALLRAAVPMRFATAGCKPAYQESQTRLTNVRAALTLGIRPHKLRRRSDPCIFFAICMPPGGEKTVPRPTAFLPRFTRSQTVTLLYTAPTRELVLLTLLLTWRCWHEDDMMTRLPLDIRP